MTEQILITGFGGHGLMSLGKIMAKAAILADKFATYFPCYGAEVRGGTAYCLVKISDKPIASPLIDEFSTAIIFNQPSWEKFINKIPKSATLIVNEDLTDKNNSAAGVKKISLPLNKIALECGAIRAANIVALGVLSYLKPKVFRKEHIMEVLQHLFPKKDVLAVNLSAFRKGLAILKTESR